MVLISGNNINSRGNFDPDVYKGVGGYRGDVERDGAPKPPGPPGSSQNGPAPGQGNFNLIYHSLHNTDRILISKIVTGIEFH